VGEPLGTHAVGIFVGENLEILSRNLPELAAEAARRLAMHFAAPIFPLKYALRANGSPAGITGTIDPLIFPRRRGQVDYAASAAICARNSNSMGLT
jgi:hypothetical protein